MNHWHILKFAVPCYFFRSCWAISKLHLVCLTDIAFYFVTKVNFGVQNRDKAQQIKLTILNDKLFRRLQMTAHIWRAKLQQKAVFETFTMGIFEYPKKTCCALKSNCNKTVSHLSVTKSTQKKPQRHFQYEQKLSLKNCLVKRGEWLTNTSCYIWIEKTSEIEYLILHVFNIQLWKYLN